MATFPILLLQAGVLLTMAFPSHCNSIPAAVWPPPKSIMCDQGTAVKVASDLTFSLSGAGATSAVVAATTARYLPYLTKKNAGIEAEANTISKIAIAVSAADDASLGQHTDYSYSLKQGSVGEITVTTAGVFGVGADRTHF
jgi:hypothetical protein